MSSLKLIITTFSLVLCYQLAAISEGYAPGERTLLDAHNCYPYDGEHADRIERALATGFPVAIEQDLVWYDDPKTGKKRSIVSHGKPFSGEEPNIETYFFERIRPIMEQALKDGNQGDWPLITLNVDYKNSDIEHVEDNYRVFSQYVDWMCYALKTDTPEKAEPIVTGPLLVLLGAGKTKQEVFHDRIPEGGKIIAFGAITRDKVSKKGLDRDASYALDASIDPSLLYNVPASNYYRWWNDSWFRIEAGGASRAKDWTKEDEKRLKDFIEHVHGLGYWLRLYTLNGHSYKEIRSMGWFQQYNFRSLENAQLRWKACMDLGVDFVATDMYEAFHEAQHNH